MTYLVRTVAILVLLGCVGLPLVHGQQAPQPTEKETLYLLGPVKTVHTVTSWQPTSDSPARPEGSTEQVFSPEGWVLEDRTQDAEGKAVDQVSYRRDGQRILEQEEISYVGPDPGRRIITRDALGRVTEVATYTLDGTLRGRMTVRFLPDGVHRTQYDASGKIISDVLQHVVPAANGTGSDAQTTANGEVIGESKLRRTPEGSVFESSTTRDDGRHEQTVVRDREGVRNLQVGPHGESSAITRDATGQTLTLVRVTPQGRKIRSVQHFDAEHRFIAAESYFDDVLRDREVATYENDDHGNWIKKTTQHCLPDSPCKAVTTIVRTISYY